MTDDELLAEVERRGLTQRLLGRCPTCHMKWPLFVGAWDRHGRTVRCRGCLCVPAECTCS